MSNHVAKDLPRNPNITHLKGQAKKLKSLVSGGDPEATKRVADMVASTPSSDSFTLRDAQMVIAREYGFDGWHSLSTEVGNQMVEQRDLHRWFGVQLNNGMWDRISDADFNASSPAKERELALYSAFASAYHWRNVGNEANWARGEHLISRMATKVGDYALAKSHAERCLELVRDNAELMQDWDEAFGFEALARALGGLGSTAEAAAARSEAVRLTALVAADGDREVLEAELVAGPWFGLG